MPALAKPRPPAPSPLGHIQTAGKQENFFQAANELASALGWKGDPDWETNDIRVEDARAYLMKVLHEAFIEGAKSADRPEPTPVCEHLAITDPAEVELVSRALAGAYDAGKGAEIVHHPIVRGVVGANVILPIGAVADAPGKAG